MLGELPDSRLRVSADSRQAVGLEGVLILLSGAEEPVSQSWPIGFLALVEVLKGLLVGLKSQGRFWLIADSRW